MKGRQEVERTAVFAAVCRQWERWTSHWYPLTASRLWHLRNTDNRQRLRGKHRGRYFYLWDFLPFIRVLYRRCLIRIFTVRSTTCRPGTTPLGIDCGRHPSCVVWRPKTTQVVSPGTILLSVSGELIFIVDYATGRFHRPGVVAPIHCPINQRFHLLAIA